MASIVHNPGHREHYTSENLHKYLAARTDVVIGDAMAQTIAAFWHTPGSPNSTLLSTQGKVSSDMSIEDFADISVYRDYTPKGHEHEDHVRFMRESLVELEALDQYIKHYQQFPTTPTGVHPCACMDCDGLQYGRKGDLCEHCEDAGCSGNWSDECERDDAYGDTWCAADYNDDDHYACND